MSAYVFQFFCGDGEGSFRPAQVQVQGQTRPKALTGQPHPPPRPTSAPRSMLPQQRPAESVGRDSSAERTRRRRRRSPSRSFLVLAEPGLPAHLPAQPQITLFLRCHNEVTHLLDLPFHRQRFVPMCIKGQKCGPQDTQAHRLLPTAGPPGFFPPPILHPYCTSDVCPTVRPRHAPACTSCQATRQQTSSPEGHFTVSKTNCSLPKASRQPSPQRTKLSSP